MARVVSPCRNPPPRGIYPSPCIFIRPCLILISEHLLHGHKARGGLKLNIGDTLLKTLHFIIFVGRSKEDIPVRLFADKTATKKRNYKFHRVSIKKLKRSGQECPLYFLNHHRQRRRAQENHFLSVLYP